MQSSSGNSYFVDSINIMATQLDVPFTGFSAAWETASGIPSFTINDELFTVSGPTTLFSNLGYSRTAYQCCSGLPVSGTGALATSYTQASEFIAGLSGSISQIDVAVGYESGVNSFFVALYSASGNAPGTLIEQWSNVSSSTTFGQCCGLATISGISGVDLVAGTSYFLVLGPTNLSSTTLDTWNLNSSGVTGDTLTATSGCQNGSGNNCNWNSNGVQTIGAFDISGSSGGKSMVKK